MKKTDKMKSPKGNKIKKTEEPFMTIDELAIIINRSFDEVCKRLSNLENRLTAVEDRLESMDERLCYVERAVHELRYKVVETNDAIHELTKRVDLLENRITA